MAGTERPAYDQALKQLLGQAHDGVLALVAPELRFGRALSPELSAGIRQADFVWEVARPDGGRGVLHLELQTQADADLGERMAEYALRLWRRQLIGLLAALAGLRLPRERLLEVLRRDLMIREILEESSVAQGWWEEGRERGREEGREEGQRELVRLALEGRFWHLEADEQAVLAATDTATLRAIVAHLTTDGRERVRSRLGLA